MMDLTGLATAGVPIERQSLSNRIALSNSLTVAPRTSVMSLELPSMYSTLMEATMRYVGGSGNTEAQAMERSEAFLVGISFQAL